LFLSERLIGECGFNLFHRCFCDNPENFGFFFSQRTEFFDGFFYFIDCKNNNLDADYCCFYSENSTLILEYFSFTKCETNTLMHFVPSGLSKMIEINYYECRFNNVGMGFVIGKVIDGGNNFPEIKMTRLLVSPPFDHFAKLLNNSYSPICSDMSFPLTFSRTLQFDSPNLSPHELNSNGSQSGSSFLIPFTILIIILAIIVLSGLGYILYCSYKKHQSLYVRNSGTMSFGLETSTTF
jgi:hypothetical protein